MNLHVVFDGMQMWRMKYKGTQLHFPKMMRTNAFELKSHIWNYEELPQLITTIQASHALVFKTMDVVVCTHVIPSIGNLNQAKKKKQVWLELDSYFNELMCITTSSDFPISANIMHKYVAGPDALKIIMCMLSDELDRGAWAV